MPMQLMCRNFNNYSRYNKIDYSSLILAILKLYPRYIMKSRAAKMEALLKIEGYARREGVEV